MVSFVSYYMTKGGKGTLFQITFQTILYFTFHFSESIAPGSHQNPLLYLRP